MKNPIIRSTPVAYGIVWALVIGFMLPFDHAWLIATPTAIAYASMHIHETSRRGHCYLSADSTAAPVSALVYVAAISALILGGHASHEDLDYVAAFSAYGGALLLGHIAAMVCALLSELLLNQAYRVRRERERQDDGTVDGPSS